MARRGVIPKGVPARLMTSLVRHPPGTVLGEEAAGLILAFLAQECQKTPLLCIDGFPSSPNHLAALHSHPTLGSAYAIVKVDCAEEIRITRLQSRSTRSNRKWHDGMPLTDRDAGVDTVARIAQEHDVLVSLENNGDMSLWTNSYLALAVVAALL